MRRRSCDFGDWLEQHKLGPQILQAVNELSDQTAERLTHPSPKTEICLVAAEPENPGEAVVGAIARASIIPGTREAEYAILVSRFLAGQGLGRQLMRKLVKWARGKYLDRLYGYVAEDNLPMLQLAQSLGFERVDNHPDAASGLVRMVLELDT